MRGIDLCSFQPITVKTSSFQVERLLCRRSCLLLICSMGSAGSFVSASEVFFALGLHFHVCDVKKSVIMLTNDNNRLL